MGRHDREHIAAIYEPQTGAEAPLKENIASYSYVDKRGNALKDLNYQEKNDLINKNYTALIVTVDGQESYYIKGLKSGFFFNPFNDMLSSNRSNNWEWLPVKRDVIDLYVTFLDRQIERFLREAQRKHYG